MSKCHGRDEEPEALKMKSERRPFEQKLDSKDGSELAKSGRLVAVLTGNDVL